MNVFFTNIIIGAIALFIIYIIKKIGDYSYSKRLERFGEISKDVSDDNVYKATLIFTHGTSNKK
jgi:hypothetical protein